MYKRSYNPTCPKRRKDTNGQIQKNNPLCTNGGPTCDLLSVACLYRENQPVAPPPPVTAPSGGESSEFGNKNGSDSNNNIVKNAKDRYNLDTIGLDTNGKKSLENTPTTKSTWPLSTTGPD